MGVGSSSSRDLIINDPAMLFLYEHLIITYKTLIMQKQPSLSVMEEYDFYLECALAYDRIGCPSLALNIINRFELDKIKNIKLKNESEFVSSSNINNASIKERLDIAAPSLSFKADEADTFSWDAPTPKAFSGGFDWGEMESTISASRTGIDFGELKTELDDFDDDYGDFEKSLGLNAVQPKFVPPPSAANDQAIYVSTFEYERITLDRAGIRAYLWNLSIQLMQVTCTLKRLFPNLQLLFLMREPI